MAFKAAFADIIAVGYQLFEVGSDVGKADDRSICSWRHSNCRNWYLA